MLVASYHILLGQAPTSHPFTLSQRTSQVEEQSAPAAPPTPVPKQSPGPKGSILPQTVWTEGLCAEPHPRQLQKGSKGLEELLATKASMGACPNKMWKKGSSSKQ